MHYNTERDLLNQTLALLEKARVDLECMCMVAVGDAPSAEARRLAQNAVHAVEIANYLTIEALDKLPKK